MRVIILILFNVLFQCSICYSQQGLNNIWLGGYQSFGSLPFGQTKLDFFNGNPTITYDSIEMDFRHTHANIASDSGNMLFYTNGYYIADASNDTMINGSGINPGAYANFASAGFLIPQGALILPKPNSNNIYYLFHSNCDNYPMNGCRAYKLYVTTVDMNLNNGLGAVISKNIALITDTLNIGKITACKAANGRDWWVVVHRLDSNKFYKLLITAGAILGPYSQNIGTVRSWDAGQMKFSPDGNKFAYYHYQSGGLDIFDFDRCSGNFSNFHHDGTIPWVTGNVGCAFSANSKVLYVSNVDQIFQYDLTSTNVISSRITVASWDGFSQPGSPNLYVQLCYPELAPDGKIYITTGNSSTYFGTIDYPDTIGLGCNVSQHSVLIPTYNFNTIPNHPNYFLGCDTTLGCICALTALEPIDENNFNIKYFPNPTSGNFTLHYFAQNISGIVEILDINGRIILEENIAPWSQYKHLSIINFPKGIYFCKLKWGAIQNSVKVIKQ